MTSREGPWGKSESRLIDNYCFSSILRKRAAHQLRTSRVRWWTPASRISLDGQLVQVAVRVFAVEEMVVRDFWGIESRFGDRVAASLRSSFEGGLEK